jgi:hypothetical protein
VSLLIKSPALADPPRMCKCVILWRTRRSSSVTEFKYPLGLGLMNMTANASVPVISGRSTWESNNKILLCSAVHKPHSSTCGRLQEPHRQNYTTHKLFYIMKVTVRNTRLEFWYKLWFESRFFYCCHTFPDIYIFSLRLFSYVLLTSLCINVFALWICTM